MIAHAAQSHNRHCLRGVTAASGQPTDATFQRGNPLLQHIRGGIHDAGVDIAQFCQREEIGSVLRIAELIAGGLVDRDGAATGGWVWLLAGMQLARAKTELSFCGHQSLFLLVN